jgi:uncharacterized protein (DUF1697 family)
LRKLALLLRAVNVGGRQLAMAELRAALEAEGFAGAQTLLASGNAVVATDADAHAVERRVEAALAEKLGLATEVLARDRGELAAVIAGNPFAGFAQEHPNRLVVLFLRGEPQAELEVLAGACAAGEEVRAGPGCLYIAYRQGQGTSKLGLGLIERRLKVKGTARNWNTVGKLAAMLA